MDLGRFFDDLYNCHRRILPEKIPCADILLFLFYTNNPSSNCCFSFVFLQSHLTIRIDRINWLRQFFSRELFPLQEDVRSKMTMGLELFDAISFFLFTLVLYFLSAISKRLGEVMGMKKYYYIYYLGIFFTLCSSLIMVFYQGDPIVFELSYVFFGAGLTCGLIASMKYWGWLIIELLKG